MIRPEVPKVILLMMETAERGEVFVPFHYGHGGQSANQHTWYARDPVSKQPQLKSSSVALGRLGFGEPEPWLLARLAELNGKINEPFAAMTFGNTVNLPA